MLGHPRDYRLGFGGRGRRVMSAMWILMALIGHLVAVIRAKRRFDATRRVVMRAEAVMRRSIWKTVVDNALRDDIRGLLRRHRLADALFSDTMFPELGSSTFLSDGTGTGDPALHGRLRIALYRAYGADNASYEDAKAPDSLVWRLVMGPLALLRSDPRTAPPEQRAALALVWLAALYLLVLPKLL